MSSGNINVPIVFRGPNGAAAGVGAQHSQVCYLVNRLWMLVVWPSHGQCDMLLNAFCSNCNSLMAWYFDVTCHFTENRTFKALTVVPCSVMQHGMAHALAWKCWSHIRLKMLVVFLKLPLETLILLFSLKMNCCKDPILTNVMIGTNGSIVMLKLLNFMIISNGMQYIICITDMVKLSLFQPKFLILDFASL